MIFNAEILPQIPKALLVYAPAMKLITQKGISVQWFALTYRTVLRRDIARTLEIPFSYPENLRAGLWSQILEIENEPVYASSSHVWRGRRYRRKRSLCYMLATLCRIWRRFTKSQWQKNVDHMLLSQQLLSNPGFVVRYVIVSWLYAKNNWQISRRLWAIYLVAQCFTSK